MGNMSITEILVIIIFLVSLYAFGKPDIINRFKHYPYREKHNKEYYRMITSGFLHGGWLHLLINMFVMWEFGNIVERYYILEFGATSGKLFYLLLFFLAIVAGDLPTYFKYADQKGFASIGASGAVSAIVFVFIIMEPWQMLYLYGIVPIPAIVGGVAYLVYSQWASNKSGGRIDHQAHIFGALFGMLFTILLAPHLLLEFFTKLFGFFG